MFFDSQHLIKMFIFVDKVKTTTTLAVILLKITIMKHIANRLAQLREAMKKHNISAYIIPGTDPHASEYIADRWKVREWISGFDGSAGTAVVTLHEAALWTDSRYFLQAGEQLSGTGFKLMKQGLPETPDMLSWLGTQLQSGETVGVDAQLFSYNAYASMQSELKLNNLLLTSADLISQVWTTDRPELPLYPFFALDAKYAGKSTPEKLAVLRQKMKEARADVFILSALDDIAWLYNIRGKDVDYNPVLIAYAMVSDEKATLFIDPRKLTDETRAYLKEQTVDIAGYNDIYAALKNLPTDKAVLIDGSKLNQSLFEAIPSSCVIRNMMSPVFKLKSIKNEVELSGIRQAMVSDGIALTRFFMWLEINVASQKLTEISIAEKLREFRSKQQNFVGESFGTIAGYAAHGAIVHYKATPQSDATLKPENILLLDSGAQFLNGTTDITRTVALGTPTASQKSDYTKVLKGHIALATAVFPAGTRGSQLDILARKALWDDCLNYGHGTGHGVGHFLCVHEGPQNIRMDENPVILQQGMVLSNEPGMYRTDEYGIRIENLIHVIPASTNEFGQFLQFETLTLFPIDKQLIDKNQLTEPEKIWLNTYHKRVYDTVSPFLNKEEQGWLKEKCGEI